MDQFKEWWSQATSRDQLALVVGGGFLALYILFMGVLKPVYEMRVKEEKKNNSMQNSLENVRGLAAKVMGLNSAGSQSGERSNMEGVVQRSVSQNGLQVSSMSASGKDGLRLRFDEASFENILKWLYEIEVKHQFRIKDLSIAAGSGSGVVSVNLRIHQG
ncbi:MAG: type II secretion system protein M [Agarilytica sp.]